MAKYTFEQFMKMDIFTRATTLENMSDIEKAQIKLPDRNTKANNKLREATKRTPMGKHLAEP